MPAPEISVVCCFWVRKDVPSPTYTVDAVNILYRSVARNLAVPHEFVCLTNESEGFDPNVKLAPLDAELIPLGNAYPKLALFKPRPQGVSTRRMLFLDLDTVITGSLDSLVERPEPAVFLPEFVTEKRPRSRNAHYNTSIFLLNTGAHPEVWTRFHAITSPEVVRRTGKVGSDQVWISEILGPNMPTWPPNDQILSFKYHLRNRALSERVRVVCFHGQFKPWDAAVQSMAPWIVDHWR